MFRGPLRLPLLALQRSAMVPGESVRNIPLRWSEENVLELRFYKHYIPIGMKRQLRITPQKKQEFERVSKKEAFITLRFSNLRSLRISLPEV